MEDRVYNVLFLCTGNSVRSIMAAAFLNGSGKGRFRAYSAGSHPKGEVHPLALRLIADDGLPTEGFHSKSWDEFAEAGAPQMDFIFTACDNAAGEACPFWPHIFRPYLPAAQIDSYVSGLILLAAAPCTAMVFVWSNLSRGEPHFTLSQVALNDTIMVFAFAPIVGLLLGLSAITVPWGTLVLSAALYIVVPVIGAQLLRHSLLASGGRQTLDRFLTRFQPLSLIALLATLVLLFGFQGQQIVGQPLVIAMLAAPILIQVYFNAGTASPANSIASPGPPPSSGRAIFLSLRSRQPSACSDSIRARRSQPSLAC